MTPLFKIGQEVQANDTHLIEWLLSNKLTTKGIIKRIDCYESAFKAVPVLYQVNFNGGIFYIEESKLIAVTNTFNSQAEIWEYLLSGGKVYSTPTDTIYNIVDGQLVSLNKVFKSLDCNFKTYTNFTKYTEPAKWYDNIPKSGILCWVGDCQEDLDNKFTAIIKSYNNGNREPFWDIDGETTWTLAIPVTQEEVNKLIYQQ